jgi:hypothetical protein
LLASCHTNPAITATMTSPINRIAPRLAKLSLP